MSAKRALAAGGLALSLAAGSFGLVGQSPAGAAEKPLDACTAVPDKGKVFDFTVACLDHDTCYIEQPEGSSSRDRKRCDQEFRQAMMAWCDENHSGRQQANRRRACKAVALVYYLGVRALGGLAWDQERPAEMA